MKSQPHIVVLGGGLIGLSCADSLLSKGARVTLVEKQAHIGHGAGQYNSGMIHPSQSKPWMDDVDPAIIKSVLNLANRSRNLLQVRRQELKCPDIDRPSGVLQLFDSHYIGVQRLAFYEAMGIAAEEVTGPFTYQRYGLKLKGDESGDAFTYMQLLVAELKRRGCRFLSGVDASVKINGSRAAGIMIEDELLAANAVVIACGSGSPDILAPLEIDLPMEAVQGHALSFDRPDIDLPDIPILHWLTRSAMTVFDEELRLSGTTGEDSPDALIEIWEEIAPEIIDALGPPRTRWSADRPTSTIGRPLIGKAPIEDLWVNTGHGHMGWSLCAASGELMADMVLEGKEAAEFALPH